MSKKLENLLALHSSLAICGLKPSNLFSYYSENIEDSIEEINALNEKYNPKYYFVIMKQECKRLLILVYRKELMEQLLGSKENADFLSNFGYPHNSNIEEYINILKEKINASSEFPHEIGVFLGYDLEDIKSYIEHKACPLMVGYWKVYSNAEDKKVLFEKYNSCINRVCMMVKNGYSIENYMKY